jgi:RNA polymerase sigma-70 factor, ECF subfamily
MDPTPGEITQLLYQVTQGDHDAESRLIPLVYSELRRLARRYMRNERPDHTLQATALVHEAYLRLTKQQDANWQNRNHFFGVAANVMRRVLVDHARAKLATKRGSFGKKVSLDEGLAVTYMDSDQILALNEALEELSDKDLRQCRVVELRFFGGLTEEETAGVLGISARTVKREWTVARAWLFQRLNS